MAFEFVFLGTGAAGNSPRFGEDLKDRFDLNVRRRSCSLIDGRYLIDCGTHCLDSLRIRGDDLSKISHIIVTHLHGDHFCKETVQSIAKDHPVTIWVREDAVLPEFENVTVVRMKLFERYTVDERLAVTGLPANHAQKVFPQHLLLEIDGKKIFYGLDGAWMILETFYHLRESHLDLCVLDGTVGDYEGDFRMAEHNSIPMVRLMLPSLRTVGIVDDHTVLYITHLAPSLHKPYEETVEICKKDGIGVAYDGLSLTL